MLWSTRYFGCLVWHLLASDNITGLFKHMIEKDRYMRTNLMVPPFAKEVGLNAPFVRVVNILTDSLDNVVVLH